MNSAQRRLTIALKSPVQRVVDPRARCEDCSAVLTRRDYEAYWDGCPDMERQYAVPRCCEDCAESQ